MPSKPPVMFPSDTRILERLGERLRLARLRRRFSTELVAARARISRTTLYRAEKGNPAITMGVYLRILAVYGPERDLDRLAADDTLGRELQDATMASRGRSS
ncbi:helix-turn-helix domain-containing protein [Aquisalimonas sp. 2447]|uniref:helix-turn-helix domain-containing protein n=1 Tax=Aquisalimonas sp. 2447 TaxID=2740807 RepID=UPI0014325F3E|nr:helix-turn-helix domain-containing protein [Aquisalimonas sp. 2447]QIT55871.1 helix-turn-helix domain-containing protein [Aquisalimonas sp. 2447]